jgi:uncharacterized protein (TIGR03086 family)
VNPLVGGVGLLERAIGYTLGSLLLVTPEAFDQPTPCDEWDLRALLEHMNDSLAALHEAVDSGQVGLEPVTSPLDLVPAIKTRACALLGACVATQRRTVEIADRTLTGAIVTCAGAVEITVHGWDVAQACGEQRPIPAELAGELFELARLFVTPADRPGRFGLPLRPSDQACQGERLVAFLGRMP